jgi:predicted nucleotidyltransferase
MTDRGLSGHRELLAAYRDQILQVASDSGATNLRLFGSVATGDDDQRSDIDLLVDLPRAMSPGEALLAVGGLSAELTELLGVPVDVATAELLRDEVRAEALRTVIPLYRLR